MVRLFLFNTVLNLFLYSPFRFQKKLKKLKKSSQTILINLYCTLIPHIIPINTTLFLLIVFSLIVTFVTAITAGASVTVNEKVSFSCISTFFTKSSASLKM